jgi:DNA polymerase-3 subunit alpha
VVKSPAGQRQVRFGLSAIKGMGGKAVHGVIEARKQDGPFRSIFDFCERVGTNVVNRTALESLIKCGAFDSTGAMRKGLVTVLDDAIAQAASAAADRKAGQMSLFGGFGAGAEAAAAPEPAVPPLQWSEAEMLAHEKAILGFYVTSHPLAAHEPTLRRYASAATTDLKRYPADAEVTLGGIISKMRTVITKNGRYAGSKMGIITLEDLNGSIEVVLFPRDLEKHQSRIALESVVFFKGKVDRKREEPSLLVADVIPIEEADQRLATAVIVRMNCIGMAEAALDEVRSVLDRFPGDKPLYFELYTKSELKVTLRAHGRAGVVPSPEFVRAMEEVVGAGNVVILGLMRAGRSGEPTRPLTPPQADETLPPVDMDEEAADAELMTAG